MKHKFLSFFVMNFLAFPALGMDFHEHDDASSVSVASSGDSDDELELEIVYYTYPPTNETVVLEIPAGLPALAREATLLCLYRSLYMFTNS